MVRRILESLQTEPEQHARVCISVGNLQTPPGVQMRFVITGKPLDCLYVTKFRDNERRT